VSRALDCMRGSAVTVCSVTRHLGSSRTGLLRGGTALPNRFVSKGGTVFYMSEVMAGPVVAMDPEQVQSLNEQIDRLGPGESYIAVLADGRVFVRGTRGISQTVIQLWRRNPAMMIPDSADYRPDTRAVDLDDL
jgi:hypothetical protein